MEERSTLRTRSRIPGRRDDRAARGATREATAGQVVAGPAFYVWEEDAGEARQWGAELADAWLASQPRLPS